MLTLASFLGLFLLNKTAIVVADEQRTTLSGGQRFGCHRHCNSTTLQFVIFIHTLLYRKHSQLDNLILSVETMHYIKSSLYMKYNLAFMFHTNMNKKRRSLIINNSCYLTWCNSQSNMDINNANNEHDKYRDILISYRFPVKKNYVKF